MTHLLDSSVLIALVVSEHEHHDRASEWFRQATESGVALCPITEGALGRFLLRTGESSAGVAQVLTALHDHPAVDFWPDSISYLDVPLARIRGHRQLTDAYLVALAASRKAVLATLDVPLAAAWPERTLLIPDGSDSLEGE